MHCNRKLLSLVLSIVLVMSVCLPCFAEETPAEATPAVVAEQPALESEVVSEPVVESVPVVEPVVTEEAPSVPAEEPVVEPAATEEPVGEPTEEQPVEEPVATEEAPVVPTEEPAATEPTPAPTTEVTEEPAPEATEEPVVEETAEPTEEPGVEATEEPEDETTEEVEPEATPVPVNCNVEIEIVNAKDTYYYGDEITFRAIVTGCEGVDYQINWEFNDNDMEDEIEWEYAASGETFTFVVTEETANWQWRAAVVIAD